MPNSVVCTLFEGHYHFGLGALINSLVANQFQGNVWIGYRGDLPPWAGAAIESQDGYLDLRLAGCSMRFVKLETDIHFSIYRTHFILDIWDHWEPKADSIFCFDPDIILKCEWWFMEQWVHTGVALCQDVNAYMPSDHPVRAMWLSLAQEIGFTSNRDLDAYYNSGFVGVSKDNRQTIEIWQQLINHAIQQGRKHAFVETPTKGYNFLNRIDQDLLNLAAMITIDPLSTVGPDGMDFISGGYLLSHAIGVSKPWKKPFIQSAIKGYPPSLTDKLYLQHSKSPIRLYSDYEYQKRLIYLRIAAAIGRFIRRN